MLLFEPERTPYDLRWRMFGTDVRVHPMFWLIALFMGGNMLGQEDGLQLLIVWVGCMFVSILVHELGHVVMRRIFGSRSHIVLYGFGGLAIGDRTLSGRWQRILVALAGPLAGFGLWALVALVQIYVLPNVEPGAVQRYFAIAMAFLALMNLFWSILNLVPIWPLDGGHISRDVLGWLIPHRGATLAAGTSFLLAGILAVHCIMAANNRPLLPFVPLSGMWNAILFGLLAIESFQLLQRAHFEDRPPWRREDPY